MAITARACTLISLNVQAANTSINPRMNAKTLINGGRRELILLSTATATTLASNSKTDLLNLTEYLKKSEENKAKNGNEKFVSYHKRNEKDYFDLLEAGLKQKKDLSESEKCILDFLESNELHVTKYFQLL